MKLKRSHKKKRYCLLQETGGTPKAICVSRTGALASMTSDASGNYGLPVLRVPATLAGDLVREINEKSHLVSYTASSSVVGNVNRFFDAERSE